MSAPVFELAFTAAPEHIDELGHVNNAVWVQWIQEAAVTHWRSAAAPEHDSAYFWVVTRHEIDYLRPAFDGDRIVARTWIPEPPKGARSDRIVEFAGNDGRLCVRARTSWAIIDKASGRPIRVPSEVVAPFLEQGSRRAMRRPILHDYPRSSAAYRVRIALNLKGVDYERRTINLLESEQKSDSYRALNPQGLIPMLEIDGQRLTQSLAIINYLDLRYPIPPLIPAVAAERAHVVAMAMIVACDIHPLNNLRVLKYLKDDLGHAQEQIDQWYAHWVAEGLAALEAVAAPLAGKFLFGDGPTGADVCLVPQLYNARRYNVPLDAYPTLLRADGNAARLEPFAKAHPDHEEQAQ